MAHLITTLGPRSADDLGMILPHEHIFVDLGPIEEENWCHATAEQVIPVMAPQIQAIQSQGITALVECTPMGVGRRADIDRAVSEATDLPVVVPTGIYRQPWIPRWALDASEDELVDWMLHELTEEIEGSGVQAAWIKLSAGDDGITAAEAKILRAAARAGRETGAIIGSHTIRGQVVRDQLDIVEKAGYTAERFIWIHTQNEPDFDLHLGIARRGAWIEYDAIGSDRFDDAWHVDHIRRILDAGFGGQLLLSHDRGWYDPSKAGGGVPKPYTHLVASLLPALSKANIDEATIRRLTQENPFRAYAR